MKMMQQSYMASYIFIILSQIYFVSKQNEYINIALLFCYFLSNKAVTLPSNGKCFCLHIDRFHTLCIIHLARVFKLHMIA